MTTILLAVITTGRCCCLLAPVDFDDSVLVDVLENVRSVHQNSNRAGSGYDEEDVQLQPIDHHRYVLPVLAGLVDDKMGIQCSHDLGIVTLTS